MKKYIAIVISVLSMSVSAADTCPDITGGWVQVKNSQEAELMRISVKDGVLDACGGAAVCAVILDGKKHANDYDGEYKATCGKNSITIKETAIDDEGKKFSFHTRYVARKDGTLVHYNEVYRGRMLVSSTKSKFARYKAKLK